MKKVTTARGDSLAYYAICHAAQETGEYGTKPFIRLSRT